MLSFPYKQDHIPRTTPHRRRPGISLSPQYITIHSTANPHSTSSQERAWLTNRTNTRQASWHIAVDDSQAVEAIPLNEVAWHAGDGGEGVGNRQSIGVEICESGNREKTLAHAVELVAMLMAKHNIPIKNVKQHADWSRKNCPRILRDGTGDLWDAFLFRVQAHLTKPVPEITRAVEGTVNGEEVDEGYIIEGRTYVPLRLIAETLGAQVSWDGTRYHVVKE